MRARDGFTDMDWDKLKVFHAAAEAGSFTHAGEQLGLSQSAVSRQVSALEQELSVSLFHRHARGLILTEQGELLYRTAHDVFMKLEAARANPQVNKAGASDGPPTQLRIWRERAPIGYARLTHARHALSELAAKLELPAENLLAPDLVRRFCWEDPPSGGRSEAMVAEFLRDLGARPWQISFTAALLREIESALTPLVIESPAEEEVSELS